jgi:hypothetical protein
MFVSACAFRVAAALTMMNRGMTFEYPIPT